MNIKLKKHNEGVSKSKLSKLTTNFSLPVVQPYSYGVKVQRLVDFNGLPS